MEPSFTGYYTYVIDTRGRKEGAQNTTLRLVGPSLFVVPLHHLATIGLVPSFNAAFENDGLDARFAHFIEVVLHPAGGPRSSAS